MRNLSVLVLLMSFTLTAFGQQEGFTSPETDSVFVVKKVDKLAGTSTLEANEHLRLDDMKGKTIVISPAIEQTNIIVMTFGTEGCNERDKMIILFDNGEKLNLTSWNKFNCNATGYYKLSKKDLKLIKTTPMETVRVTNGRTHESVTVDVPDNLKRYFIQVYKSYESGVYFEVEK